MHPTPARRTRRPQRAAVPACLVLASMFAACSDAPVAEPDAPPAMAHQDPLLRADAPAEVLAKIAQLRSWSASFHDLEGAAAAGYTANIGCVDETVGGVPPDQARGMGYHVTRGDIDLVGDGVIDIDEPEFLVYAPHPRDADLPKSERLAAARLMGFDYYIPAALWTEPDPPEFFGVPFNWSSTFDGWIRHFWLWGNNPEGLTEDYNAAVPLCTELLSP